MRTIILGFVMIMGGVDLLQADFFKRHAEGWHWYQDPPQKEEPSPQKETRKPSFEVRSSLSPTQRIEAQKKEVEDALNLAIMEPTTENVRNYIVLQKQVMDRSEEFANVWQKTIMTHPELDETLNHPSDQNALHVYNDLKRQDMQKQIKALSQEYGLFFFFKGACPYCHGFAPLVKDFSKTYGWSVLAVSLDGGKVKEFPDAKTDNGIASRLNIQSVPALLAIHPKTGDVIPLAYGMVSLSEIERRIALLYPSSSGASR